MALYNEILSGRFNRFLQKFLAMKGEAPAPQLASEIAATINLFNGVENRVLESWDRFFANYNAVAAATFQSGVRFRNPTNSNVIAVIESLTISSPSTDQPFVQFGKDTTDLATTLAQSQNVFDVRGRSAPTCVISRQNTTATVPSLATATQMDSTFLLANTPRQYISFEEQEWTVLPGGAFQVIQLGVNETLTFSVIWRERSLEEAERTPATV